MGARYLYRKHAPQAPQTRHYLWRSALEQLSVLPAHASVLDGGCGNGSFTAELLKRGYDVGGVDLQPAGIELARQRAPEARIELASVYDSFETTFGQRFDAIVSLEVIEHLYDPRAFLKNVNQSLKPNGLFVLSTPYHGWLKNVSVAIAGRHDRHFNPLSDGGHIKFWSVKTITRASRLRLYRGAFHGRGSDPVSLEIDDPVRAPKV